MLSGSVIGVIVFVGVLAGFAAVFVRGSARLAEERGMLAVFDERCGLRLQGFSPLFASWPLCRIALYDQFLVMKAAGVERIVAYTEISEAATNGGLTLKYLHKGHIERASVHCSHADNMAAFIATKKYRNID